MCFTSAVFDQFNPYIPRPDQWQPYPVPVPSPAPPWPTDPEKMGRFLDAFRKAVEAAEEFDRITGQPDCVDPQKAELEERVAELERKLAEMEAS